MMPQPQSTGTGQSVNVPPQLHAAITSNLEKLETELKQSTGNKDIVLKGAQVTLTIDPIQMAQAGMTTDSVEGRVSLQAPPNSSGRDGFNLMLVVEILGKMARESNAITFKLQLAKVHDSWEIYSYQQEQGNKQVSQADAIKTAAIVRGSFDIAAGGSGVAAPVFGGVTGSQVGYPLQTGMSGGGTIWAGFEDAKRTELEADVTKAGSYVTIYQSAEQVNDQTAQNMAETINTMFEEMRSTAASVLGMVQTTGSSRN